MDCEEEMDPENNKELTCVEITACLLCEAGIIKKNKSISYLKNPKTTASLINNIINKI